MKNTYRYVSEVEKIEVIMPFGDISKVENAPDYIEGFITYKDNKILVVNYNLSIGKSAQQANEETCVLIVDANYMSSHIKIGLLVYSVPEFINQRKKVLYLPADLQNLFSNTKKQSKNQHPEYNQFCFG